MGKKRKQKTKRQPKKPEGILSKIEKWCKKHPFLYSIIIASIFYVLGFISSIFVTKYFSEDTNKIIEDTKKVAEDTNEKTQQVIDFLLQQASNNAPVNKMTADIKEDITSEQKAQIAKLPYIVKQLEDKNIPVPDKVYFNEALAYFIEGKFEKAKETILKAITIDPKNSDYYWLLGDISRGLKDYDGAIDSYTKTISYLKDKNGLAEAYTNRGGAKNVKGDYDGAIKDCTEAIRLKPDCAKAYNNRGNAKTAKGDYDGAIKDYTEAIRLNPYDAETYSNRGGAKAKKGNYDSAIKDLDTAIRLNPDLTEAYYNRALAKKTLGQIEGAKADYKKAKELDPSLPVIPDLE